jgi:hypothetical protein
MKWVVYRRLLKAEEEELWKRSVSLSLSELSDGNVEKPLLYWELKLP